MKNEETLDILYKLRKEILRSDNDDLKSQIDHAIDKTYRDQLSFSFIGHYSAGKSSLINYLLDSEILPSSPVPTTSNTVAVEISEKEEIKAFVNQYQYVNLENYEQLRDINAQDVDIQSILLRVKNDNFKLNTVLQDTPGVDSRTKSHSLSMHRFLLNSDYIFFTVEYNHVESEKNLSLLKELVDLNIPVSFIINQVDKHNDEELSFEMFLSRVKNTLANWDIELDRIFTTSIYESEHNQVDELLKHIQDVEAARDAYQDKYHQRIVQNIEQKQLSYLNDKLENQLTEADNDVEVEDVTSTYIEEQLKKLEQDRHEDKINTIHQDDDTLISHVKTLAKDIVKNAYLFPHAVKAPITNHLKIRSGDIQVKGLFGKKKKLDQLFLDTEQTLDGALQNVLKTQIDTPVNSMLMDAGLVGQSFKFNWDKSHDRSEITTLSNDYILNYMDTLKSEIMREVTSQVVAHIDSMDKKATSSNNDYNIDNRINIYNEMKETEYLKQSIVTKQYRHFHVRLKEELEQLTFSEAVSIDFVTLDQEEEVEQEKTYSNESTKSVEFYENLRDVLKDNDRYHAYHSVIADKISRLHNNKTNLSIFGGFSAGKTTFINALMQNRMLKTSPNPTTATITEINDQSSSVVYKSKDDVINMLKVITNQSYDKLDQYVKWLKKNISDIKEMHKPFARGLIEKNDEYEPLLGLTVDEDTDRIAEKIASDIDATFIHKASVRIDSPFTENFNIIDSPGINSINQRHTNETKDIISNSDQIVYVSYYNHVFSSSDEDFLNYIKSIKGQDFPIVFIINAIDLMKSETELDKVIQYMKNALRQLDIPHTILPVSSMRALTAYDDDFNNAKQTIIELANAHKESHQLKSLEVLYQQTLESVKSNLNLYENQEVELNRIQTTRKESIEQLESLHLMSLEKITDVEIDMLLNHIEKLLSLKLYDYLKSQLSVSEMDDKRYITKHVTALKQGIEQFIYIQVATSFNSVYRRADEEISKLTSNINTLLMESNTVETLSIESSSWKDVSIILDEQVLTQYEKPLYQSRHHFKKFNDMLLQLAEAIAKDVSNDTLKEKMHSKMHDYLQIQQSQFNEQKEHLILALERPIERISDAHYQNDKILYEQLKEITHDT